jgi:MFS family permease
MKNKKIFFWAVTSALAGFLFGFDTAVISGGEQNIQRYWELSDIMVGQMVAMALYGTIIGALFGGYPAQYFGRKITLVWIALFFSDLCYRVSTGAGCVLAYVFPVYRRLEHRCLFRGYTHVHLRDFAIGATWQADSLVSV